MLLVKNEIIVKVYIFWKEMRCWIMHLTSSVQINAAYFLFPIASVCIHFKYPFDLEFICFTLYGFMVTLYNACKRMYMYMYIILQ